MSKERKTAGRDYQDDRTEILKYTKEAAKQNVTLLLTMMYTTLLHFPVSRMIMARIYKVKIVGSLRGIHLVGQRVPDDNV